MFDYFPRVLLGILRNLFAKPKLLTEPQSLSFRVWPLLDSDDFSTLAMPKFATFCGIAGWTHGYTGRWLHGAIRNRWYLYSRRCTFEFYRSVRIFSKVTVVTRLLAVDEMSALRLFEFYQGESVVARAYFQLVIVSTKGRRIPAQEWGALMGRHIGILSEWPEAFQSWKYPIQSRTETDPSRGGNG